MSEKRPYGKAENEVLVSDNQNHYEVRKSLGMGTFGEARKTSVRQAWHKEGNTMMAIKILKKASSTTKQAEFEVTVLDRLRTESKEDFNIIRMTDSFRHNGQLCMIFELLELNLYEHARTTNFADLTLNSIRPIIQQVLVALSRLKSMGIIHADVKPENIMLVDHKSQPFRVKIIDLGSARDKSTRSNFYIQSRFYRAPETILSIRYSEAIDMWSLGCVMAELLLKWPLYPGRSEYDQIRFIVATQGLPPIPMMTAARKMFFRKIKPEFSAPLGTPATWHLKTLAEMRSTVSVYIQETETRKFIFSSLDEISNVDISLPEDTEETQECKRIDKEAFVSLNDRITPDDALKHLFITSTHLGEQSKSEYYARLLDRMKVCTVHSSHLLDPSSVPSTSQAHSESH